MMKATPNKLLLLWREATLFFFLSVLLYANTARHDFTFDDMFSILYNPIVQQQVSFTSNIMARDFWGNMITVEGLWSNKSWRPLATSLYTLTFKFLDYNNCNLMLHSINILVNAMNSSLALVVTCKLVQRLGGPRGSSTTIATLTVLLFSTHPVKTEAVANVTHGCEIYSFFFAMLSLNSYLNDGLLSTIAFTFLAFLTKESGLMVLAIIFYLELLQPKLKHNRAFTFASAFSIAIMARFKLTNGTSFEFDDQFNVLVGLKKGSHDWLVGVASCHYEVFKLLITPAWADLCVDRRPSEEYSLSLYAFVLGLLILPSRSSRCISVATIIVIFTYLPSSQLFFPVGFFVAERTLYMPVYGASLLVACTVQYGYDKTLLYAAKTNFSKGATKLLKLAVLAMIMMVVFAHSRITVTRNLDWKNHESLWDSTLKINPNSLQGLRGRGFNLFKMYRLDQALKDYERIVELRPQDILYSGAMIGRIRLMKMIFENDNSRFNYRRAEDALIAGGGEGLKLGLGVGFVGKSNPLQHQAMNDLGYLLWFDSRADGRGGDKKQRERARKIFKFFLSNDTTFEEVFPNLDSATLGVYQNNANCANVLSDDYIGGGGGQFKLAFGNFKLQKQHSNMKKKTLKILQLNLCVYHVNNNT